MSTLAERVERWGDELNQEWLQKGIERGLEQGRREAARRERALVRQLAERRFGRATARDLSVVLDSLTDPDKIVEVASLILECATGEDFLGRVRTI